MATSKNAKKRRQAQQAQRRRRSSSSATPARSGAPSGSDSLPPASDTPIEPAGSGPSAPMVGREDDMDGPGFTSARPGTANWIIVGVAVVVLASAIALVFR